MPWVSRREREREIAERDRLLALVERLTDHRARLERVEAGLTETAPPPKKLLPPMPQKVRDWINSHDGEAIKERLRKEVTAGARQDGDWRNVEAQIEKQERSE